MIMNINIQLFFENNAFIISSERLKFKNIYGPIN
jgi:hypothetical protein